MKRKGLIVGVAVITLGVVLTAIFFNLRNDQDGKENYTIETSGETLSQGDYATLLISESVLDGSVSLTDVTAETLIIEGGGKETITIEDSNIGKIISRRKDDQGVRILFKGSNSIDEILVEYYTIIETDGDTEIPEVLIESPESKRVLLVLRNSIINRLITKGEYDLDADDESVVIDLQEEKEDLRAALSRVEFLDSFSILVFITSEVELGVDDLTVTIGGSERDFELEKNSENEYKLIFEEEILNNQRIVIRGVNNATGTLEMVVNIDEGEEAVEEVRAPSDTTTTSPQRYTITFDSSGGTRVSSVVVSRNQTISRPANPTRTGYRFDGWFLNNAQYNFSNRVTRSFTLTARWTRLKTTDEINMDNAKTRTISISRGGSIPTQIGNCTFSLQNPSEYNNILRRLTNVTQKRDASITCGNLTEVHSINVLIPASTYKYTLEPEQPIAPLTYLYKVEGVTTSYSLGRIQNNVYEPIGPYNSSLKMVQMAVVEVGQSNLEGTHIMRIDNDLKTLYEVSKK